MNENERYRRQTDLPQIGEEGQQKLRSARILVIGAGGLGCPAMQYLAAAGIGKLIIVDFDRIDMTNLNRQILFTPEDIGEYKAEVAARKLKLFNPQIETETITAPLSAAIAAGHLPHCDLVLDCTDNFATRYVVNDAADIEQDRLYGPKAGMALLKEIDQSRYDATVDCAFRLGIDPRNGGAFFSGWGHDTGRQWREFRQVLEFEVGASPDSLEHACHAAVDTFDVLTETFSRVLDVDLA